MLSQLLANVTIGATIIAAVAWVAKSIVKHLLTKDIDNYKTRLKAEADRINFEHQVRFSRLHEKRAAVIAELYKKLVEMIRASGSFVSPAQWSGEPSKQEKWKIAFKAIMDFHNYYDQHKIYFTPAVCVKLDLMFNKVFDPVNQFSFFVLYPEHVVGEVGAEKFETWRKAWTSIDKEDVPEARKALEQDFREILGVEADVLLKQAKEQ